jgi:hypothetical protein
MGNRRIITVITAASVLLLPGCVDTPTQTGATVDRSARDRHLVVLDDGGVPRFFELDGSGEFPPGRVVALSENPAVSIDGAPAVGVPEWGLASTGAAAAWTRSTGTGVVVAVLDTGVDTSHAEFAGRILPGKDFVDGNVMRDPNGHGTHVAGIVAAADDGQGTSGLAPTSTVLPVRVLDAEGFGTHAEIAAGIVWAVEHGADVVNMSLGGESSDALAAAVVFALDRGVVVVAAAGNNGGLLGNEPMYPAAYPGVLAVGAATPDDSVALFSTTGPHLRLVAPGFAIRSTIPGGYGYATGTSQAAPFAAAAAALLIAAGTPARSVGKALTTTARDIAPTGRDDRSGAGALDAGFALTGTRTSPPVPTRTDQSPPPSVSVEPGGPIGTVLLTEPTPSDRAVTARVLAAGCATCIWTLRTSNGTTYQIRAPEDGEVVQQRITLRTPSPGTVRLYADDTLVATADAPATGTVAVTETRHTPHGLHVVGTSTRAGAVLRLEALRAGAWSVVATTTPRAGSYTFDVTPAPHGFYRVAGDGATSDPFRV